MKHPLFSIIIPTLNEEKFLPKLLGSLSAQTRKNFEVIVVDGSSRDATVKVANQFVKKLPSLRVVLSKKRNVSFQRNIGAQAARGNWFVFVDADSVLLPYFMDRVQSYIAAKSPYVLTTWASPDSDKPKDAVYTLFANIYIETTLLFKKPLVPGPLTVVSRWAFEKVGGYDEAHAYHEDVDLGLRFFQGGIEVAIVPETLYIWSLRRFRKEGIFKVLNQYAISMLPVIFFNTSFKHMPGYIMGGHVYGKKKRLKRSMLKTYERKLTALLRELFA